MAKKKAAKKKAPAKKSRAAPARRSKGVRKVYGGPLIVGGNVIPICKCVRAGDFVFCSGQVPFKDGAPMTTGSIEEQTEVTMLQIKEILEGAGCKLSDIIKANVWLRDKADFAGFNKTYAKFITGDPPARSTVQSNLMVDVRIEIEVTAYKPL
ncbi:MAG: RidA family protein [Alphaproteobacteria bacterium]|nr:RidA family protein [Alphaproteobacteria bacterium]